ncbi:MAG TPA: hypothetical protein PKK48_06760 [Phycisphaerae bacterium]|nr:hypothetical protein [Phycisphaerae bacterium]HPS52081.1 hypothetical protein [Phycisphaerae bacterium]
MKQNSIKNLLNSLPFDDTINQTHKAKLKDAVLHVHAVACKRRESRWRNAAVIIFAIGMGLAVSTQIWRETKKHDYVTIQKTLPAVASRPTLNEQEKPPQAVNPSIWSKKAWKKRFDDIQLSQNSQQRIIWISPTRKPILGEQR